MHVTVSIVTMDSAPYLARCLDSLREPAAALSLDVVILDNCSGDGSAELAARLWPAARILRSDRPAGFAANQNRALTGARGRYLLLLNPDACLLPGCLERLVAFLDERPDAGAVAPRLFSDESLARDHTVAYRSFPTPGRLFLDDLVGVAGLWRLAGRRWPVRALCSAWSDPSRSGEAAHLNGACLLVRREAAEQVGPLDERFPLFREETDWCLRLRRASWRLHYLAEAHALHVGGASLPLDHPERARLWERSTRLYLHKHGGRPAVWTYLLLHLPLRPLLSARRALAKRRKR